MRAFIFTGVQPLFIEWHVYRMILDDILTEYVAFLRMYEKGPLQELAFARDSTEEG